MIEHAAKILMFVESTYPHDVRVNKEALALTRAGYSVMVIAIRGKDQKATEVVDGVMVYRIPRITLFQKTKGRNAGFVVRLVNGFTSIVGYAFEYLYFTTATLFVSLYILMKRGFDIVHMNNPPDTLAVVGIFYKLFGKKYVFDHHDLSPELYLTRVSGKKDIVYRSLLLFEKLSCKFADVIISTNESYRSIEINRHAVDPKKIYIVRNNPNFNGVIPGGKVEDNIKKNDKKTLLFLGSINPQDGIDVLLQVLYHLVHQLNEKNFTCNIVGGGDSLEPAIQMAKEMELSDYLTFTGMIYDREKVKEYLSSSDIGVEPAPLNDANEHSTFIKVMEYMAAGKPVVAFDLKETRFSADTAALLVPPDDVKGFASAIKTLLKDPSLCRELGARGRQRIREELNWDKATTNLLKAYQSITR